MNKAFRGSEVARARERQHRTPYTQTNNARRKRASFVSQIALMKLDQRGVIAEFPMPAFDGASDNVQLGSEITEDTITGSLAAEMLAQNGIGIVIMRRPLPPKSKDVLPMTMQTVVYALRESGVTAELLASVAAPPAEIIFNSINKS